MEKALWIWMVTVGGDLGADGHGDLNVSAESGAWSAALQTDTLDLRWRPAGPQDGERGRSWLGLRVAGFAAQMLITPWMDGAPDPARAMNAGYVGLDGGGLRYAGGGVYGGLQGSARQYFFYPQAQTAVEVPGPRLQISPEAVAGWWSYPAEVRLWGGPEIGLGSGAEGARVGGRAQAQARWEPGLRRLDAGLGFLPLLSVHAGIGAGLDDLINTRIGGMNPYVVPLAGAAWAEFHASDDVAARLTPRLVFSTIPLSLRAGPVVDLVAFRGATSGTSAGSGQEVGLSGRVEAEWRAEGGVWSGEVEAGGSPTLARQEGVAGWSVWFRLGWRSRGGERR